MRINGGVKKDLVVTLTAADGAVQTFLGQGDGTFVRGPVLDVKGPNPMQVLAIDFDQNGFDDIVTANNGIWPVGPGDPVEPGNISVLMNNLVVAEGEP